MNVRDEERGDFTGVQKCAERDSQHRDRLLFLLVCVYKSAVGLAAAASLAEKRLGVSSLHEPSKVILTLLFYCTLGQMLARDILQSLSFCTCSVGQEEFYLETTHICCPLSGADKSDDCYCSWN